MNYGVPKIQTETRTATYSRLKNNCIFRFYKTQLLDSIIILKNQGFRALIKQKGRKILLTTLLFYLIRDTLLYILIPILIAHQIMN
jgi:hypothetical protein